ncbi:MAG: MerR family transcriptional regulator [Candidatus Stygibacter frigidus]|nr:MerR family transcriptional regulator [Candidatus Stygibacter frigidus]
MAEKEFYYIGEVAKQINIHEQTIREYERRGLIKPQRSTRNTRIFTKKDLLQIEIIITLTQELGINLSGVKLVMELAEIGKMSDDELLDFITDNMPELLEFAPKTKS